MTGSGEQTERARQDGQVGQTERARQDEQVGQTERARQDGNTRWVGRILFSVVVLQVVLAGCVDLVALGRQGDPIGDPLGWEEGYWYDDDVAVTTDDGLNRSERRAVVARAMARVEHIRRLEFRSTVPVTVVSRAQYRERFGNNDSDTVADRVEGGSESANDSTFEAWNNQVWEALFLVGEGTNVSAVLDAVYGSTVQGFYSPSRDEIVVVSETDTPTIHPGTLAHELVHAVRDQRPHEFSAGARTQDAQLAADGLIEGDANTVQSEYERRCDGAWACLPRPEPGRVGQTPAFDRGVFLTVFAPYAEGPGFIAALRDRGGWAAVNDAYRQFPESTEQIIHPAAYPDEDPVDVAVPDRSSRAWSRFDLDLQADTVGEASIHAMFEVNGQASGSAAFDYSHPRSAGWGGDAVVPYRSGNRYGYVWKTVWDTRADADEFAEGYRAVLRAHDASEVEDGVYVVPDSDPFGDAFRVTHRGNTVVVVNAPTRADLAGVHRAR